MATLDTKKNSEMTTGRLEMNNETNIVTLDLRDIVPLARHDKIFSAFENLDVGQILSITNDHDPKPLYYQFSAEYEGEFEWTYRVEGPVEWKVDIKKVKEKKPNTLKEKVEKALMSVRPYLRADGGDIELVDVNNEGVVFVRLVGACHGCPGSTMTLQMGVERILKEQVPEVKSVEAI